MAAPIMATGTSGPFTAAPLDVADVGQRAERVMRPLQGLRVRAAVRVGMHHLFECFQGAANCNRQSLCADRALYCLPFT